MPGDPTFRYQPALDGVRALAVVAVLLFHSGIGWMSGGYLGVSVFFTLSGFLITTLLLREGDGTGRVDVVRFYTRRARRLLPASLVCVLAVCALAAGGQFAGVAGLRRDVVGALFQVFNWVKLGSGQSYADLNNLAAGLRHPLDHYWSLSIEEQFYWVWPVTVIGLLRLRRRWASWTMLRSTTVLLVVFGVAAPLIAVTWGENAAYWATPARAAEILAGVVLACWCQRRPTVPGAARWLGPSCLALLGAACVLFPDGSGPAYRGALPLIGLLSAGLILGLQVPGPLRSMLSTRPLVGIGKISYGIYLYHWPIYVLIDRRHWDAPVGVVLAIKAAITVAVALVSYFLIERPVRRSVLPPRRTLVLGLAGIAVVGALVVIVPNPTKFYAVDSAAAQRAAIDTAQVAPLTPASTAASPATRGGTAEGNGNGAGRTADGNGAGGAVDAGGAGGASGGGAPVVSAPPRGLGAPTGAGGATAVPTSASPPGVAPASAAAGAGPTGGSPPGGSVPPVGPGAAPAGGAPAASTSTGSPPGTSPLSLPTASGGGVSGPGSAAGEAPSTVPVPPRPVRILVAGDSTAEATGNGLISWAAANPALAKVSLSVREGCGFVGGGYIPYGASGDRDVDRECAQWLTVDLPATVKKLRPDVVVMLTTSWDVLDRKLAHHGDPALPVTDPAVRAVVDAAMSAVTNRMLADGASRVVWLREPIADPYWLHLTGGQRDPANHQVLYDEMAGLATTNPAVRVVDLAGYVDGAGLATDAAARPDGVHWTPDHAKAIATEFLGPAIVEEALT